MLKLNGEIVNVTMFPDKTSQVWKLSENQLSGKRADILWDFEYEGEFTHLAQVVSLLRAVEVDDISLFMPYLPYARQDKPISNATTFALRTFADQLNRLDLAEVKTLDVHSHVATRHINKLVSLSVAFEVGMTIKATESDLLCYPDKGAETRYTKLYNFPHISGQKVRDQSTGTITSYLIQGDPKGNSVLIIDDICDGGMTFILLAKQLLQAGAKEVNLFVTHGIFSKGVDGLAKAGIKRIFTHKGELVAYANGQKFYKEFT